MHGLFGGNMLRKFPPQSTYPNQKGMGMNMGMMAMHVPNANNQFHQQKQQPFINPQFNNLPQHIDLNNMNPQLKREFYGERLFLQISSAPIFANDSE